MLDDNTETLAGKGLGLHDFVAEQFSLPRGLSGRTAGATMRFINWLPNRYAIESLGVEPTSRVLEIGFGPGHALKKLCRLACDGAVFGIDRSPTMLQEAAVRNRNAIADGMLLLSQGSCESLPFESASMDRILAVNVIYFVMPLMTALAEAHRILRPGGVMSLYVTDRSTMRWLQFIGPETRHTFDVQELEDVLRRSVFGAEEIEVRQVWLPAGFRGLVARLRRS